MTFQSEAVPSRLNFLDEEKSGCDRPVAAQRTTSASITALENQRVLAFSSTSRSDALQRKLSRYTSFTADEVVALDELARHRKSVHPEEILVHAGEFPEHVVLVLEGLAYRYKLLRDGHRQILGYLLPGDMCDVEFVDGSRTDHSVAALDNGMVARIPLSQIAAVQARFPSIDRAFGRAASEERAILRRWLLNVGQRNALQRISYFICELSSRLEALGRGGPEIFVKLPIGQAILADTTGVTTVHVNRILKKLRRHGLISLRRNELTVLDPRGLAQIAGYEGLVS